MRRRALMPLLRLTGTGAHLIVDEDDIHAPIQAVLHGPMSAYGAGDALGIRRQAADIEAPLKGRLAVDAAFRFDHRKGFQIGPLLGFGQAIQLLLNWVSMCMAKNQIRRRRKTAGNHRHEHLGRQAKEIGRTFVQNRLCRELVSGRLSCSVFQLRP
jgi:hypothetical protein